MLRVGIVYEYHGSKRAVNSVEFERNDLRPNLTFRSTRVKLQRAWKEPWVTIALTRLLLPLPRFPLSAHSTKGSNIRNPAVSVLYQFPIR